MVATLTAPILQQDTGTIALLALPCHSISYLGTDGHPYLPYIYIRSYHTLVVDVYARCYIYWSRTEIFISCVCPTCSISLAERIYRTRSKIFITLVGVDLLYITSGAQRTRVIYNRSTPYPGDKYFWPSPIDALSKWYRTGRTDTADKYFSPQPINVTARVYIYH